MKSLRPLLAIVGILTAHAADAPRVPAPAAPAPEEFRLRFPKKDHLSARQLYELGYPAKVIDQIIGQFVLLEVVVVMDREEPLVDIEIPRELAAGPNPPRYAIPAHLINSSSFFSSCKKGERLRIEGIIVHEGYGAYMIYLENVQRIK